MDDARKQQLKGSPNRDEFKRRHKDLDKSFWAMDIDLALIAKSPEPDMLAVIDYKTDTDDLTFTEVIGYNAMLKRGIRVYIVQGDAFKGEFDIKMYVCGHHGKPTYKTQDVCKTTNWDEFEAWERDLRKRLTGRFAAS